MLNRVERERLQDSRLRIQSIVDALSGVDANKVPHYEEINNCLRDAVESLKLALGSAAEASD